MASGIIIGTCPECGEIIWEDQWAIAIDDGISFEITHDGKCARDRFRRHYGMSERQFQRAAGIPGIEKDLLALSAAFQRDLKELEGRYMAEAKKLSDRLQCIKSDKVSCETTNNKSKK